MRITTGNLDDPKVQALLAVHLASARAATAAGSAHGLEREALRSPDVQFWTAWEHDELLGCAALKRLSPHHGEIKSMHTAETARRRGVGRALLAHVIEAARAAGLSRLSLETGSWPFFEPARALYRRAGFEPCAPFGPYRPDPNSVFMTLELGGRAG